MYFYTPLCRYWIALYRYVLVFIVPHVDIELEDNKQFISNIPRIYQDSAQNFLGSGEEDITIYGHGGHRVQWRETFWTLWQYPFDRMPQVKSGENTSSGLGEENI